MGVSVLTIAITVWLIQGKTTNISDLSAVTKLGGLDNIKLTKVGKHHYALKAAYARETHIAIGGGITTTLATYYELYSIRFECTLSGMGHVYFEAEHGKLDLIMKRLRLDGPVSISFDSGYHAKGGKIDINLISGLIKPENISIVIHGISVPMGSRQWLVE